MSLSLDWTASVPDLILQNGLRFSSRFKRVLADLLYMVHGNMEAPGKPSLADVCPLLYTSVRLLTPVFPSQTSIFQFFLTDTHLALLREDGVFHPVPRGSTLVPVQPQFQSLEVRSRSQIRCFFSQNMDGCVELEIVFDAQKTLRKTSEKQLRRRSVDVSSLPELKRRCPSWKIRPSPRSRPIPRSRPVPRSRHGLRSRLIPRSRPSPRSRPVPRSRPGRRSRPGLR